ncbi:MAG: hypothetical protein LAT77_04795 [Aliidiomarina sp.]|uniref:SctD/MshK family protein n=1 Tax=Aliidiomarina sp. TaxID=1872439 RepID=UPI0025B837E0|nr:hypothetical protein [Aliidiomarina sp.]MCH8501217.1 hypothetical protein [Aliidiomarina sp.]
MARLIASLWTIGVLVFAIAQVAAQEAGERDPTRPQLPTPSAQERQARLPNLSLGLIRKSAAGSVAIINEQTYGIGDVVSGWTIRNIEVDRVLLERNNEVVVLSVFSGLIRQVEQDDS